MKRLYSIPKSNRGIALIITLTIMAIVLVLVLGFVVSMRTERNATLNNSGNLLARELAKSALDEAVFLIRANSPIILANNAGSTFWVSQPGRMVRMGASYPNLLYTLSNAGSINLNADNSIIETNSSYSSPSVREINVNWINVCTDGQSSGAPLIGRYAFWVDDEATKVNIGVSRRRTDPLLAERIENISLDNLWGIGVATADGSYQYATNTGFFTPEDWRRVSNIGPTTYDRNKFYITTYTEAIDQTPWGAQKKNLNDSNSFTRNDVDTIGTTLTNESLAVWFGANNNFTTKFGNPNQVKQILANIFDFRRAAGGATGAICTGADAGWLYGDSGGESDDSLVGIPKFYHGLRRFPFLNEISVQAVYWRPIQSGQSFPEEVQLKVWVRVEVVNPFPVPWGSGGQIVVRLDKNRFRLQSAPCSGPTWNDWWGYDDNQANYENWTNITVNIPANSYQVFDIPFWFNANCFNQNMSSAWVPEAYIRLDKVMLFQGQPFFTGVNASDPNIYRTIRDWACGKDFSANLPSGQFAFPPNQPRWDANGNPDWSSAYTFTQGLAKNDPRVRTFTSWDLPSGGRAWYRVGNGGIGAITHNAQNTVVSMTGGTGLASVPNDPVPTGAGVATATNVVTCPSFYTVVTNTTGGGLITNFYPKAGSTDTNYASIGELGQVHTGLQWRSLMLQPRPTAEANANLIPDWVVLDTFTLDPVNQFTRGRINVNASITNLTSASMGKRIDPLDSLILQNPHTFGIGVNPDATASRITSNIYNRTWAVTGSAGWQTKRQSPFNFPSGAYGMIGELCEIDLVAANFGGATNDAFREARIRSFANLVTVRSERFRVWTIGQAIQDVNNNGSYDPGTDVILGETKGEAVVQRLQQRGADDVHGTSDDSLVYRVLYYRERAQ